jgi:hypothetical protein
LLLSLFKIDGHAAIILANILHGVAGDGIVVGDWPGDIGNAEAETLYLAFMIENHVAYLTNFRAA